MQWTMGAPSARSVRNLLGWLTLLLGCLGVALWSSADGVAAQEAEPLTGDVDLGGQLYAQACAQCHASDGRGATVPGTDRTAPELSGRPEITASYVDLVLRTGRMPPAEDPYDNQPRAVAFDDAQREAIVAYVTQEFELTNDLADVTQLPEGDPGAGQAVYAANCAACHGSTGAGGVAGGGAWTPVVNMYDTTTITEAIRIGPFQMPAFGEDIISDQEAADVGAFLEEVRSESGTPLGLVELNPVFASGFVALLAVAMILSLFWISSKPTWFPDPDSDAEPGARDVQPVTSVRSADGSEQA
jgi:ubiquinol-cytochrome c reductase cytochrome c subunit